MAVSTPRMMAQDAAIWSHDRHAPCHRILYGGEHWLVHVSPAEGLHHDPFSALINCRFYETAVSPTIHGDYFHGRRRLGLERNVLSAERRPGENHSILVDCAEDAEWVDWDKGNDKQYSTLVPVQTSEEIAALKRTSTFTLMTYFPRLQFDGREPKWIGKD